MHTLEFPRRGLVVQDEGATIGENPFEELNFVGTAVEALANGSNPEKADVTFTGGSGASITGCYVYEGSASIGSTSPYVWAFSGERWDPDGMFNAGVDDEKIYFLEQGYWLVNWNCYASYDQTKLLDDVDKIAYLQGVGQIYADAGLVDGTYLSTQCAYALSATSYKGIARIFCNLVYRHDGSESNPYAQATLYQVGVPGFGSWNTTPTITVALNAICLKIGDI